MQSPDLCPVCAAMTPRAEGFLGDDGLLKDDPRDTDWRSALQKHQVRFARASWGTNLFKALLWTVNCMTAFVREGRGGVRGNRGGHPRCNEWWGIAACWGREGKGGRGSNHVNGWPDCNRVAAANHLVCWLVRIGGKRYAPGGMATRVQPSAHPSVVAPAGP